MIDLNVLTLGVLALAVLLTGISKSGFAGALGILTVPLLSLVMPLSSAVAVMLPILLLLDVFSVRVWWSKQHKGYCKTLIIAGLFGVFVGYFVFALLDESLLAKITGTIALLFAINGLFFANRTPYIKDKMATVFGVLAGFTSTLIHAGGPPLNAFLLSKKLEKKQFIATSVMFYAAINLAKVIPFLLLGAINYQTFLIALLLAPLAFISVKLGYRLQQKIPEKAFFQIIHVLLLGLGLKLVFAS